jgi:hypothetical protein
MSTKQQTFNDLKSVLTRNQKKTIRKTVKDSKLYPEYNGKTLKIKIRYDDECNNGRNSFAITGECGGDNGIMGCIHEFIEEQAPEFSHLIKWHLCSSDEPMYYLANSLYHVKEVKANTVVRFYDERIKFDNIPFTFKLTKRLKEFLATYQRGDDINIIALKHPDINKEGKYQYGDNYTFNNCLIDWYKSLFSNEREAQEMAQALKLYNYDIVRTVSSYEDEKKPNLEAARSTAIWEDAELEDFTEEKLKSRLPELMKQFRLAIESLDFIY